MYGLAMINQTLPQVTLWDHRKNLHYLLSIFQAVPKSHWAYSYPSNMCADTPRITAVMAVDGYRDFPAIARLPVICTFGNPPDLKTRSDDEVCSAAAYFDKSKGRCVCTEEDMVQVNPSAYPNTPLVSSLLSLFKAIRG
ncbi:hypothetical protein COOONC_01690 [Cooperia oncophora]